MRILFTTDSHLSAVSPINRIDDFKNTILNKMFELGQIAKYYNCNLILHGGDLFNNPSCNVEYLNKVIGIILGYGIPMYVVPGNHDLYGYNINTLPRTSLGTLAASNVVGILDRKHPLTFNIGNKILQIEGQEYKPNIDAQVTNDCMIHDPKDLNILISHSQLVSKPFFGDYTLIDNVQSNANIIISGHYHEGFREKFVNNTMFFNPGAMTRQASGRTDIPKCLILDIDDNTFKYSYMYVNFQNALPKEQIFNLSIPQQITNKQLVTNFKNQVAVLPQGKKIDILEVLKKASVDLSIKQNVFDEALKYINIAQQNVDVFDATVKGFIPSGINYIKEIEIKNRHTYKNQKIEFTNGFNVIEGETGCGKTNILRAIEWVLYNEPKGNNFIRTGEKSCSAKLTFTDGSSITRKRTKSSTGNYTTNINGVEQEYKGFGSEVPIEVINLHQMPEIQLAKDYKVKLNLMEQSDLEFLIRQSGTTIAYCIGNIIPGTQTIDVANKNVNLDNRNISIEINKLQKEQQLSIKELENYKQVDSFLMLTNILEQKFNNICSLNTYCNNLYNLNTALRQNEQETFNLNNIINSYNDLLNKEQLLDKFISGIKELETLINLYINNINIVNDINSINNDINGLESDIQILSSAIDKVNNGEEICSTIIGLFNLKQQFDDNVCKINSIESIIKNLENKISSYPDINFDTNEFEKEINLYIKLQNNIAEQNVIKNCINDIEQTIAEDEKEIKAIDDKFKLFIHDNNICPVCGHVLNFDDIKE